MIWTRVLLDGVAMGAVFNLTVALFWLLFPNAYAPMLPKEIKEAAPAVNKKERRTLRCILYSLYVIIVVCPVVGLLCAYVGYLIR